MKIEVERIDHIVLTVANIRKAKSFYEVVLGMKGETFGNGRYALVFGSQKINLHEKDNEFEPKAKSPTPGSGDLCFIMKCSLETFVQHLKTCGIQIVEGPVNRTGAIGPIRSVYFRDPDDNLIEAAIYDQ